MGDGLLGLKAARSTPWLLCLSNASAPCDDGGHIPCRVSYPLECLRSPLRPWTHTYTRARCCLSCCMQWWVKRLSLDRNEEHWHNLSRRVTWKEESEDFSAANLDRHAHGESLLLGDWTLATLAHGNMFSFHHRSTIKLVSGVQGAQKSKRAAPLLVHSNTASSTLPMLQWLSASNRSDTRALTLVSKDDADQPSGEALQLWRHLVAASSLSGAPTPQWFIQNSAVLGEAPGLRPLPIGVPHASTLSAYLSTSGGLEATTWQRTDLLMCCCMQTKLKSRVQALASLRANGFPCTPPRTARETQGVENDATSGRLTPRTYYETLARAKFVASPNGFGRDCYRTWEALALGAVPILQEPKEPGAQAERQKFDGMPIVWVTEWEQVTPAFLEARWRQLHARLGSHPDAYDMANAYFPRWLARLAETLPMPRDHDA